MNQENNMQFYQVVLNLLNPFNYLFGCGELAPAPAPALTQAQPALVLALAPAPPIY